MPTSIPFKLIFFAFILSAIFAIAFGKAENKELLKGMQSSFRAHTLSFVNRLKKVPSSIRSFSHSFSNSLSKSFSSLSNSFSFGKSFPSSLSNSSRKPDEKGCITDFDEIREYWIVDCDFQEVKKEINFILLGDTGGYEYTDENENIIGHIATPGQWLVAMAIQEMYAQKDLDFVLLLGDNFYDAGVGLDDREERFKLYLKLYTALGIPFYSEPGNNDYKVPPEEEDEILNPKRKSDESKNVKIPQQEEEIIEEYGKRDKRENAELLEIKKQRRAKLFEKARERVRAQIDYEMKGHPGIWNFPAEQYIVRYKLGNAPNTFEVVFVMIDTVLLCGTSRKDFLREDTCDEKTKAKEDSLNWLRSMLTLINEKKPAYLFVAGHYPLYVTKGKRTFSCAKELQEIFIEFNVTAYIAGHEHNLKYIKRINKKIKVDVDGEDEEIGPMVPQIVSGGGSRLEDCREKKHAGYMTDHIDKCYPKGIQKKKGEDLKKKKEDKVKKNKEKLEEGKEKKDDKGKKEKEKEGKKTKNEEEKEENDTGTVFGGGAFIAAKITKKGAIFKYFSAGREYPIEVEDIEKERKEWKNNLKEIFKTKEQRDEREAKMVEEMAKNKKYKTKKLEKIELKPNKWIEKQINL